MAPMALGRIDIKYRRVACQVPQNLNVIVDQNRGSGGWIRLQVKVCSTLKIIARSLHYIHNTRHCTTHQPVAMQTQAVKGFPEGVNARFD